MDDDNLAVYLSWDDDGVKLVCHRMQCSPNGKFFWTERLEGLVLPEDAVLRRAKHLATHPKV